MSFLENLKIVSEGNNFNFIEVYNPVLTIIYSVQDHVFFSENFAEISKNLLFSWVVNSMLRKHLPLSF